MPDVVPEAHGTPHHHHAGRLKPIHIQTLDLENPTAPSNYPDEGFLKGSPLYWQNTISRDIHSAIKSYFDHNQTSTPKQLKIIIAYIQHHIHAPWWLENSPCVELASETKKEILSLREQSLQMESLNDIRRYINASLNIGLDPL